MESDIFRRKSRPWQRRALAGFLGLFLCLLAAGFLLSRNMRPAMLAQAEARIRAVAGRAMNDAILASMENEEVYAQLVQVRDNGDHVYLLQANTRDMNILAADCANAAQTRIAELGEMGISIPVGTITGVSFLSGKGPAIRASFTPAGSVQSAFRSEFVSAGINQSLYRVNLALSAAVKIILPGVTDTVTVKAEAAICESILVGAVPEVYTNVANEEDMLNLIPTEIP